MDDENCILLKNNAFRMIKNLTQSSDERVTQLVQEVRNGRILVISTLPKREKKSPKSVDGKFDIKKYVSIQNRTLIQIHPSYLLDTSNPACIRLALPYYIKDSLGEMLTKEFGGKHSFEWTPTQKSIVAFGIAVGLRSLHTANVIHGRLHPFNILLDRNLEPIITDYWTFPLYTEKHSYAPIRKFMPHENISTSSDIYSYASVLQSMASGNIDFDPKISKMQFVSDFIEILEKCISTQQEERPKIDTILSKIQNIPIYKHSNQEKYSEYVKRITSGSPLLKVPGSLASKDAKELPEVLNERIFAAAYKIIGDTGDSKALMLNGIARREGRGCSINKSVALRSLKAAADAGLAEAQFLASQIIGVRPKNNKQRQEAFDYLRLSADAGFPEAQYKFGIALLESPAKGEVEKALRYIESSASQGFTDAQYYLSKVYADGTFCPQNDEKSLEYVKMAARNGHAQAQYDYARRLIGDDITKNAEEIRNYLVRASNQNITEAKATLASLVARDKIELESSIDRNNFIRFAANSGDQEAIKIYARLITTGEATPESPGETSKYLKIAADSGDEGAMLKLASLCLEENKKDYQSAMKYLRMSADSGNLSSAYEFGALAWDQAMQKSTGRGDLQREALSYMKRAADGGDSRAILKYAHMVAPLDPEASLEYMDRLADTEGIDPASLFDVAKACVHSKNGARGAAMMKQAADLGSTRAMVRYAKLLARGRGADGDASAPEDYMQRAVDAGDQRAALAFGNMLSDGTGVEVDPARALACFEAAVKGKDKRISGRAAYNCYLMRRTGDGCEADRAKADQLLKLASELGNASAGRELDRTHHRRRAAPGDLATQMIQRRCEDKLAEEEYDESDSSDDLTADSDTFSEPGSESDDDNESSDSENAFFPPGEEPRPRGPQHFAVGGNAPRSMAEIRAEVESAALPRSERPARKKRPLFPLVID